MYLPQERQRTSETKTQCASQPFLWLHGHNNRCWKILWMCYYWYKDSVYLRSKVTFRWLDTGLRYNMIFYKQKFRHIDDIFLIAWTGSSLNNFGCGQWRWYVDTLKRKCRHVDEAFAIACVGSCPAQPVTKISSKWHFWSNVSLVVLPLISHPKGVRSVHCESIKRICFISQIPTMKCVLVWYLKYIVSRIEL